MIKLTRLVEGNAEIVLCGEFLDDMYGVAVLFDVTSYGESKLGVWIGAVVVWVVLRMVRVGEEGEGRE